MAKRRLKELLLARQSSNGTNTSATGPRRKWGGGVLATFGVAVAVGVTLIGSALISPSRGPQESRPLTPSAADVSVGQSVRDVAGEVYTSFAGTERQQDAGWVLRAYVQNHAMDACLENAGFPEWDWSQTRVYANPVDPLASGTWLAEPNRFNRSEILIAQRERLVAEDDMNQDEIPADEDMAINSCLSSVKPGGDEAKVESAARSAIAQTLMAQWDSMVGEVAGSAGDLVTYNSCMEEAAIPLLDDLDLSVDAADERLAAISPNNEDIPTSPTDPVVLSEPWQQFVDSEASLNEADWSCREDAYVAFIDKLVPAIDEFAARHSDEILQAQQEWIAIEDAATDIGYHGQVGPLGG